MRPSRGLWPWVCLKYKDSRQWTPWRQVSYMHLFLLFGHAHGMQKYPGQGSNPCHSSNNAGYLTCWATRELHKLTILLIVFYFCFLGPRSPHMEVPRSGIKPMPQQYLLHQKGTPVSPIIIHLSFVILCDSLNIYTASSRCSSILFWTRSGKLNAKGDIVIMKSSNFFPLTKN